MSDIDVTYELKFVLFTIGMVLFTAVSMGFLLGMAVGGL